MSAVAKAAGVATGTSYTYYSSKHDLLLAAYVETKAELSAAATRTIDSSASPGQRFVAIWLASYRHLAKNREHAAFLLQIDCSPYRGDAHDAALSSGRDPVIDQVRAPDFAKRLLPLPLEVLYDLGLAPAMRLAASRIKLSDGELEEVARACWRTVSTSEP